MKQQKVHMVVLNFHGEKQDTGLCFIDREAALDAAVEYKQWCLKKAPKHRRTRTHLVVEERHLLIFDDIIDFNCNFKPLVETEEREAALAKLTDRELELLGLSREVSKKVYVSHG